MRAMILAAGLGERMRPLTDHMPKPLLQVNARPLIQYHVENLVRAGLPVIVINHARLGVQIERFLGDGSRFGAHITYSPEGDTPLETGGGIVNALPLLEPGPFAVINADIWTDFPYNTLQQRTESLAHLVLVPNPPHHRKGDFSLQDGMAGVDGASMFTFSGIAVYRAELFAGCEKRVFSVAPLLKVAAARQQVTAELYTGEWMDIGTPERLQELRKKLAG